MKRDDNYLRLKKIINNDESGISESVYGILKSDLRKVLSSYFYMDGDVTIETKNDSGQIKVAVNFTATGMKNVRVMS